MGVLIVRDEWVQDFELMGNDLLIYARLYSFTQNVGCYAGSMEWLAQSVGVERKTAIRAIDNLINKNLVKKEGKKIKCFVYDAELEPDPENEPILYQNGTKMYQNGTKSGNIEINEETPENRLYQNGTEMYQNGTPVYQNGTQIINIKENKKIKGGGCTCTHTHTHEGDTDKTASTTTTTTHHFFVFYFHSKIKTKQDYDDAVKLSELMNEEQAQIFHSWVMAHKPDYHIGFYLQHHDELLRKACEWDAQREQAQYKSTKIQTPTPAPPQVEQMQAPADTPTATSGISFSQWRAMVADVVKKHPKTKHKDASVQSSTATRVANELTTENTTEQIHEYLSKIFAN